MGQLCFLLMPTIASFLPLSNMEAEAQLEMKSKKWRLTEIIQVSVIHKTLWISREIYGCDVYTSLA